MNELNVFYGRICFSFPAKDTEDTEEVYIHFCRYNSFRRNAFREKSIFIYFFFFQALFSIPLVLD